MCAIVESLSWQTTTEPNGAALSIPVHESSDSSCVIPSTMFPLQVHTFPTNRIAGSKGRISFGSIRASSPSSRIAS